MEINTPSTRQQLLRLVLSALVVITSGFGIVTATSVATSTMTNLSISNSNMAANSAETLCFVISLSSSASNTSAGKNSRATLNIASQQA